MRYVKLVLSLAFFVPVFTLFGLAGWHGFWYGGVVGALMGVFFGLVFGGNPNWKFWDFFFGPKEVETRDDDNRRSL